MSCAKTAEANDLPLY